MAIRYSGDVEVRVRYARGVYHGSVRSPGFRGSCMISALQVSSRAGEPTSPESYDRAAMLVLREAEVAARKAGIPLHTVGKGRSIEIRRTFQAPCPYR